MTERLSEVIARLLGKTGAIDAPDRCLAIENWPEAAGEKLAAMTQVRGFRGAVLMVSVDHPVAAQELRLREQAVLAEMNRLAGRRLFSRIAIVSGGNSVDKR